METTSASSNRNLRIILIVLIIGFMLVLGGCTLWRFYQAPLGPELEAGEPAVIPSTVAPAVAQGPVCGETGAWNLLVLAADTAGLRGDPGSDFNRVVRVDFTNRRVTSYALSRDLWVNTSGLGLTNPTIDATELGIVFYEAFQRSPQVNKRDALIDATNTTARMIAWNFSIRTDHYVTVDINQVPAMVDAVGGIPINIPERTTDPWIGMVFEPGQQTLNGAQVVAYAAAIPDSDFGRINRQQLLAEAIRQKLLDPTVWARIPDLYMQFNQVVATDLSLEQINHLSCLMKEVPGEAIIQDGVRPEWISPGPDGSFMWDKNSVINHLISLGLVP